jgi:preprotein translocase subunit SecD
VSGIRRALAIAAAGAASLAPGCGDEEADPPAEEESACAVQPADGAATATFRAEPAESAGPVDQEAVEETAALLCERAAALGLEDAYVAAAHQAIEVRLPPAPDAEDALDRIAAPLELAFYDWEANLVRRGDPEEPSAGTIAVEQTEAAVTGSPEQAGSKRFLLRDRPALTSEDIASAEQDFDSISGQPVVAFDFTAEGEEAFEQMTLDVVKRAAAEAPPGVSPERAIDHAGHFAIVLDDEVIALPAIDFLENPDGIDGSKGAQISGALSIAESQELAEFLEIGPLPVELVREP